MTTINSALTQSNLISARDTSQSKVNEGELSTFDRLRGSTYSDEQGSSRMEPPPPHPTSSAGGSGSSGADNASSVAGSTPASHGVYPNESGSGAVVVNGNTISWPDDGWYEVQSATSYNTMSEGGQSADLPSGVYNVINHTTGERFENVHVGPDVNIGPDVHPLYELPDMSGFPGPASLLTKDVKESAENTDPVTTTVTTLGGDVEITVTPGKDWGDIMLGATVWGTGAAATTAAATGPGAPLAAPVAGGTVAAGIVVDNVDIDVSVTPNIFSTTLNALATAFNALNPFTPNPSSTNTPLPPVTTTTVTDNGDGTSSESSTTHHGDGSSTTVTDNGDGSTSVTQSKPDTSSTNSPMTNTTTTVDEQGTVVGTSTTVTSPTGMTIGPAGTNGVDYGDEDPVTSSFEEEGPTPEEAAAGAGKPTTVSPSANQNTDNDSNSHGSGGGGSSGGGANTGTGNETSSNPHTL